MRISSDYLVLLWLFAVAACSTTVPVKPPQIKTSPLPAYSSAKPYWLDDDEILFVGQEIATKYETSSNLYIWKISDSTVRVVVEDVNGALCFNRGKVVYGTKASRFLFSGPLGSAKEESVHRGGIHSFLTCNTPSPNIRRVYQGHPQHPQYLIQLLEEHGVLELPPEGTKDGIAYLHSPNRSEPVPIPKLNYRNSVFASQHLAFHSYIGAYLIAGYDKKTIRWLYPSGEVVEQPVPMGPWRDNQWNSAYLPVKNGIIAFDWNHKGKGHVILEGAYLVRNTHSPNFLPTGYLITKPAISPSGCRVAFNFSQYSGKERNRIGLIDLCKVD